MTKVISKISRKEKRDADMFYTLERLVQGVKKENLYDVGFCYGYLYYKFHKSQLRTGGMSIVPPMTVFNWALQSVRRWKWLQQRKVDVIFASIIYHKDVSHGHIVMMNSPYRFSFVRTAGKEYKITIRQAYSFTIMSPGPELSWKHSLNPCQEIISVHVRQGSLWPVDIGGFKHIEEDSYPEMKGCGLTKSLGDRFMQIPSAELDVQKLRAELLASFPEKLEMEYEKTMRIIKIDAAMDKQEYRRLPTLNPLLPGALDFDGDCMNLDPYMYMGDDRPVQNIQTTTYKRIFTEEEIQEQKRQANSYFSAPSRNRQSTQSSVREAETEPKTVGVGINYTIDHIPLD